MNKNLLLLGLLGIVVELSILMLCVKDKQVAKLLAIVSSEFATCELVLTNCHVATYDRMLLDSGGHC